MATNEVLLPKDVNAKRIAFAAPKLLNNGGKSIFIQYGDSMLRIQTPRMKAPFGVSMWQGEAGKPDKYDLHLSFDGAESRESVMKFKTFVEELDEKLVAHAFENSQLWFKKKYPAKDVLEDNFTPSLKYSKDRDTGEITSKYAPTIKLTLPTKNGEFDFPVYNGQRERINLMDLVRNNRTKGAQVEAILQVASVWMVDKRFGISWKVKQLKFLEPAQLNAYAFKRTDDDDDEEEEAEANPSGYILPDATAAAAATAAASAAAPPAELPDSDAEQDPLDG